MLKKVITAYFKLLSQHLPGRTEESHKNLIFDSLSPGWYLNHRLLEYELGVLTTGLQHPKKGHDNNMKWLPQTLRIKLI